jgi:hypothetical protein
MRWKLVDLETGAETRQSTGGSAWGARVKIRLINQMDSDHFMPIPSTFTGRVAS